MQQGTQARIVLTTVASQTEAERLARALVEERVAACVNIVPQVLSVYRWNDAVESAGEVLMVIKTMSDRLDALKTLLHQMHSYELPEFLVLDVASGSEAYLGWVRESVGPGDGDLSG